ncbi:MAG: HU family DNA-binding protein [Alphaproteobacteria bacterium]|nr:HU family DNA-binding protein [Alphaproteobacteria bacterium]
MNKNDLVSAMASNTGLSKVDSAKALDAFVSSVSGALANGDEVRLIGFGTFSVTNYKGGTGRNPRTGETLKIAPRKQPKFKAGKGLKDNVNK